MKKAIYRILINWYQATGTSLPDWLRRACERDEELQQSVLTGEELTNTLRKAPKPQPPPLPEGQLSDRVMREVARETASGREKATASFLSPIGYAAAALVALLVLGRFFVGKEESIPIHEEQPIAVAEPVLDLEVLSTDWKNPLEQEMEYVLSDARGALDFLAENFVPSAYTKTDQLGDEA